MTPKEKVALLREEMKKNKVEAFIVYSADPHMSEYLPKEWQERVWLSGFTGSAGYVVVTEKHAGLWTDGRYFTQAPLELKGSGIDLFKDGIEGTPNYVDWIISETSKHGRVAVNALATSHANWKMLKNKLEENDRELIDLPLLEEIWKARGGGKIEKIFVHPTERAGRSTVEKIEAIRKKMKETHADLHLVSSLDDVAWTLNLRGHDVECNPVFLSYLSISPTETQLFVNPQKLTEEAKKEMEKSHVRIREYSDFFDYLLSLENKHILVSPTSNQSIFNAISDKNTVIEKEVPGHLMKAIKNETELQGFRTVMERDGVAMVKFLYWLTHNAADEKMDEFQIGARLEKFRAEGENFVGPSFGSIVGYQGNGAIIHYSAKEIGSSKISNSGSILVDSGGQYLEGTTDITRTLPLGQVSEEFKHDSTLVLKGLIQLSMLRFPKGTRGVQLDAFARLALWNEGKDYNHGTGHGVGSYMNVHEGPQSIRKDLNPVELAPGMVVSNEPGYYLEGKYGIRHENLITVKEWKKTEWNTFYEFETLTICPFFKSIIVKELLSEMEIKWLNDYHQICKEKLGPHLHGEVKDWFLTLVTPL